MSRFLWRPLLATGLIAWLCLSFLTTQLPIAPGYTTFDQAWVYSATGTNDGPPFQAQGIVTALPARWTGQGAVWYRLEYMAGALDEQALFIARAGCRVELWVGDRLVARWGARGDRDYDQNRMPLLQPIETAFLHPGRNDIWLRIEGDGFRESGLSKVVVGDRAQLKAFYHGHWLRAIGSAVVLSVASGVLGLVALVLGFGSGNPGYRVFSLAALAGAARGLPALFMGSAIPLWMHVGSNLSFGLYVAFIEIFAISELKIRARFLIWNPWLLIAASLVYALSSIVWPDFYMRFRSDYFLLLLLSVALAVPFVIAQVVRLRNVVSEVFLSGVLLGLVFGGYDYFFVQVGAEGFGKISLSRYATPLFLGAMIVLLLERNLRALKIEENMSIELSRMLAARESELRALYERQSHEQQMESLRAERERIMQDMHDGLGMHLNALKYMLSTSDMSGTVPGPVIRNTLQEAIDQLRLTVDTLSPVEKDVTDVLAQLRYRLDERLKASGIRLTWEVGQFPDDDKLPAQHVVHLQYLLYEIFANIFKHAGATNVIVRTRFDAKAKCRAVEIIDNGRGFDVQHQTQGKGLQHLRQRSSALGAQLSITRAVEGPGTRVEIMWCSL